MRRDLTGRVIVITGAGSGIGAATAVACAQAGMDLVIADRWEDRLKEVASRVRALGSRVEVVAGDVTEAGRSEILLDAAKGLDGSRGEAKGAGDRATAGNRRDAGFYSVFANAGVAVDSGMAELSPERLRRLFEVNFFAGLDLLQQAAKRLLARGRPGHLLMCSSCLGRIGLPFYGAYCATKAAQLMVCKAMNLELRERGIFVSSVHPIATRTDMLDAAARESGLPPGSVRHFSNTPKMFIQSPERVARAVVKTLRKRNPPPEIWTSHIVRTAAGLMTMFPRFNDWVMRKETRRRRECYENGR